MRGREMVGVDCGGGGGDGSGRGAGDPPIEKSDALCICNA